LSPKLLKSRHYKVTKINKTDVSKVGNIVVNIRFISPDTLLMAIFLNTVVIAKSVA